MAEPPRPDGAHRPPGESGYDAFISYSRADRGFAVALEAALEGYRPPRELGLEDRHLAVFRDEADFTGTEYTTAVTRHLRGCRKLIVICTPAARASRYVADEIRVFAELRGPTHIIPILLAGIANNESTPGREAELAFPDALCDVMPMPLAASYRGWIPRQHRVSRRPFEGAWLTVLANLYDVERSVLEQREQRRQRRTRRTWTSAVAALILALSGLTAWGLFSQRDAVIATEKEREARRIGIAGDLAAEAERTINQQPARLTRAVLLAVESMHPDWQTPLRGADALRQGLRLLPPRPVRLRQQGLDPAIAMSPDGGVFATLGRLGGGRIITVFADAGAGKIVDEFRDSTSPPVEAIAVGPGGRQIALVRENSVSFWQPGTQTLATTALSARIPDATLARFSTDGRYLAVLARGGAARVLDVSTQKAQWLTGAPFTTLAFSADAGLLAFARSGHIVSVDQSGLETWGDGAKTSRAFKCNIGVTRSAAFSHDATHAALLNEVGMVHIVMFTGSPVALCRTRTTISAAPQKDVTAIAIGPSGKTLAVGGSDGTARVWSVADRRELALMTHGGGITGLEFDGTGQRLVTTDASGAVSLWDVVPSIETRDIQLSENPIAVTFSEGNTVTALTEHGEVVTWRLTSTTSGPSVSIRHPAFVRPPEDPVVVQAAALSPGGNYLGMVTGDGEKSDLLVVDLRSQTKRTSRRVTSEQIDGLAVRADGELAVLLTNDTLLMLRPGDPAANVRAATGISAVAFEPSGRQRLTTVQADGTIAFLNPADTRSTGSLSPAGAGGPLVWSPDGRYLATVTAQRAVRVWDIRGGSIVAELPLPGLEELRALSPDAAFVATMSGSATSIWEIRTGRKVARLTHGAAITDVAFSPDGKFVATVSEDLSARVWLWHPKGLVDAACDRLPNRELDAADWLRFVGSSERRPTCGAGPSQIRR